MRTFTENAQRPYGPSGEGPTISLVAGRHRLDSQRIEPQCWESCGLDSAETVSILVEPRLLQPYHSHTIVVSVGYVEVTSRVQAAAVGPG